MRATETSLRLSRLAECLAPILYVALHYHRGGHGSGRPWAEASPDDRALCRVVAEEAVMSMDLVRRLDAEQAAQDVVVSEIRDAAERAMRLDEDHSRADLVRDALNRMARALGSSDLAVRTVSEYRRRLRLEA